MAVLNAQYKHPQSAYSQGLKELIDSMLKVNPSERPDINEVGFYFACLTVFCLPLFMADSLLLGYSKDGQSITIIGMMNMITGFGWI